MDTKHCYFRFLRTLTLVAFTAAATAACSDDNDEPGDGSPETNPAAPGISVAFTADINPGTDANPAGAPSTRTVLKSDGNGGFTVEWKGTDKYTVGNDYIYIQVAKSTGEKIDATGVYYPTTSAASSSLGAQLPLTLPSAGDWTFTAFYGIGNSVNNFYPANIKKMEQSEPGNTEHIARKDFSVATTTQHVEANTKIPLNIGLRFEHKLSALQLHVKNATGADLSVKEIHLAVDGEQMSVVRYYDPETGGWKTEDEEKSNYLQLTVTAPVALATGGTAAQDFHMLLFPGYAGKSMTITVITDRGEYTLKKSAPPTGFAAGKNYTTNIEVKSSGLGTDETWSETIAIANAEQLAAFRDRVNDGTDNCAGKTVLLTADIDLTGETWTPIGNLGKPFKGTFDGGKHHIEGLTVNSNSIYAGLFGLIEVGTVRNLRVSGTVTSSANRVGGIVGSLDGGIVENCLFSGSVEGQISVGGIAGRCLNAASRGCHTQGTVKATDSNAGGIAGTNDGGSITDCYSSAAVVATSEYAGGIVGNNSYDTSVDRCYATGEISASENTGGIIGENNNTVTACIALNPSITRTQGANTHFGRIAGNNFAMATDAYCFAFKGMKFTDATTNQSITNARGEDGTPLTAAECLTKATYTTATPSGLGWTVADAGSGWVFDTGTPWEYLPWNKAFESFSDIQPGDYRIAVPSHLTPSN